MLSKGRKPTIWPHTAGADDQEIRKRITTALIAGESVMVWDNVVGMFDSASLAAFITSEQFTDRILGQSKSVSMPNKTLLLITGNNLTLKGDMVRRVLVCRIDPKTDQPFARTFDLNPLQHVLDHRQQMVAAVLTLIRGFHQQHGLSAQIVPGSMASFEVWDRMVRQPIAWIGRDLVPGKYVDVMDAVKESQGNDPETETLLAVLLVFYQQFRNREFSAKEVKDLFVGCFAKSGDGDNIEELLKDLAGKEVSTSKSIGLILKYREGRVVGGYSLVGRRCKQSNRRLWRVLCESDIPVPPVIPVDVAGA